MLCQNSIGVQAWHSVKLQCIAPPADLGKSSPPCGQQTMCSYVMMRSSAAAALSCSGLGDIGLRRMQAVSNPAQLSAATPSTSYGNQRSASFSAASYKLRLQRPADISRQSFQAACRMRQRRRTDCRMQPAALDMQKRELLVGDVVCLLCFCFYKQVRARGMEGCCPQPGVYATQR